MDKKTFFKKSFPRQFKAFFPIGLTLFIVLCSCEQDKTPLPEATINIWYGDEQPFGTLGHPQKQINILGNVQTNDSLSRVYYTLNDATDKYPLTLGSDLHRLAAKGDFNIEIDRDRLQKGANTVEIQVEKNGTP